MRQHCLAIEQVLCFSFLVIRKGIKKEHTRIKNNVFHSGCFVILLKQTISAKQVKRKVGGFCKSFGNDFFIILFENFVRKKGVKFVDKENGNCTEETRDFFRVHVGCCTANQLTGFYFMGTLVFKRLSYLGHSMPSAIKKENEAKNKSTVN